MRQVIEAPSPNWDDRAGTPVDMLVLHYTGMPTAGEAVERLRDAGAKVSAHYVVEEDGRILRLVAEDRRAWHAGVAFWRGGRDVNARSVGVEIVNPGHEFGYRPYPDAQMAAVVELSRDVVTRWGIPPWNVVGHSDVAPRRKSDPGELFGWRRLAIAGVGLWPEKARPEADMDGETVCRLAEEIGYETEDPAATITAFQRRFRGVRVDGLADAETAGLLRAVRRLCP